MPDVKEMGKHIIREVMYKMPHQAAHSFWYFYYHHKLFDNRNPCSYDEKIHYLMANVYDESYSRYADKNEVREYVKKCGLESILVPIYGIYERPEDIDYTKLPKEFILKATHGSGDSFYVICEDKERFNIAAAQQKLTKALKIRMEKLYCEYQYAGIRPKIICEKLLHDKENRRMTDYKVVCAKGEPIAILVCSDRDAGRDYYSLDWKYLEYVKKQYRSGKSEKKPKCLAYMLDAARILSRPFPLSRIDFYIVGEGGEERLYFGEITLTPSAGNHCYLNEKGQIMLGKAINVF